jgi:hypothetical protein
MEAVRECPQDEAIIPTNEVSSDAEKNSHSGKVR